MNTTTPDAAELAAFTIQARAALAEAVRRDRLYGEALALGFEPGPARQVAALAVETEKQTGLDASAYILGTANMLAAESPTAHDLARLGWKL